jgi:hypothetical protein
MSDMMTAKISLTSSVRVNDDVLFQELQGEAVLLNLKTGVYFGLDTVGTQVWKLISENKALSEVLKLLVQEYDVSEEQCSEDLLDLVASMREQALVSIT